MINERITELSMEAETYARSICNPAGNYRNEETDEVKPFWRVSREKFAELIILECAGICMIEYDTGLEPAPQAPQIARQIKQHFGVE